MAENQRGFTLIELMIVIAIIGILASIAVPQYTEYSNRARFSEVVMATTQFKSPAEIAFQTGRATAIADLDAGVLGIPNDIASGDAVGDHVDTVEMLDGVITATGAASVGGGTFTLSAAANNDGLVWTEGGSCLTDGLC